ncbi:hypothetical protein VTP01DRAFT_3807 [Rhizomucor pusillus]|uniref:uncharacterized protein n=1 Tax=Rhizomucor pusillus TaxID=4840 RepID=UPI0037420FED
MLKRVFSSKRDKKKAQQEDSSQLKPLAPSCCCSSCSSSSSATSSSGTYQATAAAARVYDNDKTLVEVETNVLPQQREQQQHRILKPKKLRQSRFIEFF